MKTILVEDNPSVRNNFKALIKDYCPDIELIGVATNVKEGVALLTKATPELLFLDVEMPDGTGFDLLKKLSDISFQLIFITAHEKYAIRAIRCSALDYLLKPIDPHDLIESVKKAKSKIEADFTKKKIEVLLKNVVDLPADDQIDTLLLKDKYGVQLVSIKNIIHLQADGSYTKFYIDGQESIVVSKGLKDYESLLPKAQFFRCHQSHLINITYLTRYDKREGDFLILKGYYKVPLASRKKDLLFEKIAIK